MKSLLLYLDARLGEPSTWVAIGGLLSAAHVSVAPGALAQITIWAGVFAFALGVLLKEAGNKPPQQIAADVLGAFVQGVQEMQPVAMTAPTEIAKS